MRKINFVIKLNLLTKHDQVIASRIKNIRYIFSLPFSLCYKMLDEIINLCIFEKRYFSFELEKGLI